jgi:MFS family permease
MKAADRKIFATLFFSIFVTVTGVGIVVPLLPVYAHSMGASGFLIGLIFGAFSLSRTVFLPFFGKLSDQKGRKPFIVVGMGAYAAVSIGFVFAATVESLIIVRFLQGIASAMLMPVIQAYIGDITPVQREGVTMGMFNISMFMGLSLGPLIGGVVKDQYGLQAAFFSMGLLAAVGFCSSLILLPPIRSERAAMSGRPPAKWMTVLLDKENFGLFAFRFGYVVCVGIVWGFMPVLADQKFSLSSSSIGFLVMLGVLISGLMHLPMGYLADRLNKSAMVAAGGAMVAVSIGYFGIGDSVPSMVAAMIGFGVGGGVAMPALMAMAVIQGNRTEAMGSVMGILTAAHSLGMLIGAVLAGIMMDLYRLNLAFYLGAVVMAACTLFFLPGISRPQRGRGTRQSAGKR